ncbi:TPA_exp: Uncharacterized protein A8136_0533 [Trichophyton benhamiae CBS 112371]|nr:TPA_exp: Uncharacterized protein A8136_0533 [Trichophyton benhamiae CBS 112371]
MATLAMQSLGCEVAALNTVHFSNHTGYRQFKGTKSSAQEITNLYEGLRQSYLTDFDVLLTGYAPSATAVEAVGAIAMDLKKKASKKPGSFFWVLDPVMGDQGRIYVNEDVVPAYKALVPHADLILPNQFEAETYNVPHVIVTSVQLPGLPSSSASSVISLSTADNSSVSQDARPDNTLAVFGSTMRSDRSARLFKVEVPRLDCFFSGTGDMFGALMVGRLREAVFNDSPALRETASWVSPDSVATTNLPLAKATEKVLASMHTVLEKTMIARNEELARYQNEDESNDAEFAHLPEEERKAALEKRARLRASKAAEVRLVRNVEHVRHPVVKFKVREWNQ